MTDENMPRGPRLGGPALGKGPNLQKEASQAKSGEPTAKISAVSPPKKKAQNKVNVHELVRKWGVKRRALRDALQTLMLREIKTVIRMTHVNEVFKRNVIELLNGQLEYFEEVISLIKDGKDEISKKDSSIKVSYQVFETLGEIISEEIERLSEETPVITEYIDKDLKRFRDARVEPRASFWVLWYAALQIREIRDKAGEELDIVLEVMLKYPPVMRRVLGVFLNFIDALIQTFPPFTRAFASTRLIVSPAGTGYNMAPWIKTRYGTYSQNYIEYERFLVYYARSFGSVPGNAPEIPGGILLGYREWIQRALVLLEERMKKSKLIVARARGNTLEGMLVGMEEELKEVLATREYDEHGKLINQPVGGEGAVKFLQWLFHTALNRYTTTNIAIHKEARLSLDMFDFIPGTVRWVNEYGEQIVIDWLED